jgi:predicted acylesterase/phospholipase RssA
MKRFGHARQLFAKARAIPATLPPGLDRRFLGQQHALCTYKDTHLPADIRYEQALSILSEVDDLLRTKQQETLGLAGAIYKYKWEAFGQKVDLERSASYYTRGYHEGVTKDLGYTAVNAAFVLDLLAFQESEQASLAGTASETALQRRRMAHEIRATIVKELPLLAAAKDGNRLRADWWFLVTVAEAYFGLGDDDKAKEWIENACATSPDSWQIESTLRQFASLAHLRDSESVERRRPDASVPGWSVLEALAGPGNAKGIQTALIGKVGLALSGGGFRASLFHIGVLARLAELDALRHIEVISCVSGGSIVGAQYYLDLQHLLQSKKDEAITREDYIELVGRLSRVFLEGVQTNIRTRVVSSFWANFQMVFRWRGYSRTDRVAKLCDEKLLSRAGDCKANRLMTDLMVHPADGPEEFSPSTHNWTRAAKVPVIVFNATTLNTGHNWQFTATYMGEPPTGIDSEIDGNYRLRRMYYKEAPRNYREFPLARAVASSACVPGLFEPVPMVGLYEHQRPKKNIAVQLVDGGVQDNQGIGALLDEGCSVLLVSDASGQMAADDEPGNDAISSLVRSGSIAGSRVREAEYRDVAARRRSSLLRGLMFIHLKKGLDTLPIDWIGCEDPAATSGPAQTLTPYGIRKDVQELLAGIRTDLDSFHDVEAYALMTSGYRMTEYEFNRCISGFPQVSPVSVAWPFLAVEPPMKQVAGLDQAHEDLKKLLTVSHSQGLKIFRLSTPLRIAGWTTIALAGLGLLYMALLGPELSLRFTLRGVAIAALFAALGAIIGKTVLRVVRLEETLRQVAAGLILSLTGWLIGGLHLIWLDKLYLKRGRVR